METTTVQHSREGMAILADAKLATAPRVSLIRMGMSIGLLFSDATALLLAGWAAIAMRTYLGWVASKSSALAFLELSPSLDPSAYHRMVPALALFPLVYASRRLYPTIGMNRVEEVRQLTISTSVVVTLFATLLFLSQQGLVYSRLILALFWGIALCLVPAGRILLRKILARLSLWGVPAGVAGAGSKASWTVHFLASHPNLGFRPVVIFGDGQIANDLALRVPRFEIRALGDPIALPILRQLDTLIVVEDETPVDVLRALISEKNGSLPGIVMMPDLPEVGSIWVQPIDLGGVLALKIRNNLASPWQRFLKRSLDIVLGVVLTMFALPVMAIIAAAIRLDSRGPLFYRHLRIGRYGRRFGCWKFRTMVADSDRDLEAYLEQHPELRGEWEGNRKLKCDPRITRVGRLLRKFSLDELPQLWNVLKGEMSLVGPRPIVSDEVHHYAEAFHLYCNVRPGITGLWQVSGRNDVGYKARVSLDAYYVRNWSVWLDLYILARTPWVVLSRKGAY